MKRYIRLKELPPGADVIHTPVAAHIEVADETLIVGPYRCRVDSDGFMLSGNPPVGGTPIVFLGDSFVESMFTNEQDRFVSHVERVLGITCLNAGYSGSTTLQLLNALINKVYPAVGPGATVVLFAPHSDRDNIYDPGRYWNNKLRGATVLPLGVPGHAAIPEGVASTAAILNIIVTACDQLNLKLVLATAPYRVADFGSDAPLRRRYRRDRAAYELGRSRRVDFCDTVRRVAEATATPLIDVEAEVAGESSCFYDELHLNPAGHIRVTAILTHALARIADRS